MISSEYAVCREQREIVIDGATGDIDGAVSRMVGV